MPGSGNCPVACHEEVVSSSFSYVSRHIQPSAICIWEGVNASPITARPMLFLNVDQLAGTCCLSTALLWPVAPYLQEGGNLPARLVGFHTQTGVMEIEIGSFPSSPRPFVAFVSCILLGKCSVCKMPKLFHCHLPSLHIVVTIVLF